tara:strand:+ start:248 stop:433 length:186 start_codon:yes stop_codon:yes gene_type:complete
MSENTDESQKLRLQGKEDAPAVDIVFAALQPQKQFLPVIARSVRRCPGVHFWFGWNTGRKK